MAKAEIGQRAVKSREPVLGVPVRDPAKAHPEYRHGGPAGGYRNLREHQEGLNAQGQRPLNSAEARHAGWPEDEITKWFGAES